MSSQNRDLAKFVAQRGSRMREVSPDLEGWQVIEQASGGYVRVGRPGWPEGQSIAIPVAGGRNFYPGMPVDVGFQQGNRAYPFAAGSSQMGYPGLPSSGQGGPREQGLWVCPEGSARLSFASLQAQPQMRFSNFFGAFQEIVTLDRTANEDPNPFPARESTDILGLLLLSDYLLCLHAVWQTGGLFETEGVLSIAELDLTTGAVNLIEIPEPVERRNHFFGNGVIPNRRQGYFFVSQTSEGTVYTVAVDSGIISLSTLDTSVQVKTPWAADPRRSVMRSGNIACSEQYLCECAYTELKHNFVQIVPGGARVQTYKRSGLDWNANAPTELASLVEGLSGQLNSVQKVYSVGLVDPEYWTATVLSHRWPFLSLGPRREFWCYLSCVTPGPMPRLAVGAIDAKQGGVSKVAELEMDPAWHFLYDGLVATESQRLSESSSESLVEGDFVFNGASTREADRKFFQVNPGSDPPQVEEISFIINPRDGGWYYTGNRLQAPGFHSLAPWQPGERFLAAPFPPQGPFSGGGNIESGEVTSGQIPSGVFDAKNRHYLVVYAPERWVNGLTLGEDKPPLDGGGSPNHNYPDDERWHKFGDRNNLSYNPEDAGKFFWWFGKLWAPTYLPSPECPVAIRDNPYPQFAVNTNDPSWGNCTSHSLTPDPGLSPAGNANCGPYVYIKTRNYALKQHGRYTWESRWKTILMVSSGANKQPLFTVDLSKSYVDGPAGNFSARLPTPQLLNVWQWAPVIAGANDYLWILRQDYVDPTPNSEGVQTAGAQEPYLELWQIDSGSATLLQRLHCGWTGNAGQWQADYAEPPRMMVGATGGPFPLPYCTVWTEWSNGGDRSRLVTEVLFDGSALVRVENWNNGEAPSLAESCNAVHHDGRVYWLKDGQHLVSKQS